MKNYLVIEIKVKNKIFFTVHVLEVSRPELFSLHVLYLLKDLQESGSASETQ